MSLLDGLGEGMRLRVNAVPRLYKQAILVVYDIGALSFAVWAAYSLRIGMLFLPDLAHIGIMARAPVVALPIFARFGLYRSVIRYLPERAFGTIANAVVLATLFWIMVLFIAEFTRMGTVPRSVPPIYCLLAMLLVGGARFMAKYLLWGAAPTHRQANQIVIYGAGSAGVQLASALQRSGERYVLGFIDDNVSLQGTDVAGIRVYPPAHLPKLMETTGVRDLVLSLPSVAASRRREIVTSLADLQLRIHTIPAITDLVTGRYLVNLIREIDIDDLLGRSSVPADPELLRTMIEDRSILVSGAGGSIGSELCKLMLKWRPRRVILLEANEFALYQIERQLASKADFPILSVLGSVRDDAMVRNTLKNHAVQSVFHAAAHKHVPLVEANVLEGVKNNIFGTKVIAEAALDAGVENFVLISSDKAVRPTNVMGATKRWAELIIHQCAQRCARQGGNQKFCAVRFGNVLGSNGSVVPLFKEQIAKGGPLTITDDKMTRYFMSIHEAAELIVQAGALSKGGDLFLLEMGKPVRIVELAENMIRLSGLSVKTAANPKGDIAIDIVGARPGEKLYEELFYDPSSATATRHPKILRSSRNPQKSFTITSELAELSALVEQNDEVLVRRKLFEIIQPDKKDAGLNVVPLAPRPTF